MSTNDITVSEGTLQVWQSLLDLMAIKYEIPSALIMKIDLPDIKVFMSSESDGNPYKPGDSEEIANSGLYCETVMRDKSKLLIPNALIDPEWENNPDIKLGMIAYVGFPIQYPDGGVFGTICLLDKKENSFRGESAITLEHFRNYVESYIDLAIAKFQQAEGNILSEKEARCDQLLRAVEEKLSLGTN